MPNNKIYLGNLDNAVNKENLKEHFSGCGEVTDVNLPIDRETKKPKNYAFITFADEAAANQALELDGKPFLSNIITVQIATEKRSKKKS